MQEWKMESIPIMSQRRCGLLPRLIPCCFFPWSSIVVGGSWQDWQHGVLFNSANPHQSSLVRDLFFVGFNVVAGSPWHIFCPTMWSWMLRTKISSQGGGDLLMPTFYLSGTWFLFWQRSWAQPRNMLILDKSRMLSGDEKTSLLSTAFHCKIKISKET